MNLDKLFLCLGFIFIIAFVSCKHEERVVFSGKIPEEINKYINTHKYTTVIYVETAQCTTCSLSNLLSWKVQKKTLDKYDIGILLVFDSRDENKVIEILKSLEIAFMFIFDKGRKFKAENIEVFNLARDNTFVIDKDKNVIFTGSPIANEEKWKSFIKCLKHY
jgi:Ni,Fe-hydrogenase I small subunit